jgi:hypothetical protein
VDIHGDDITKLTWGGDRPGSVTVIVRNHRLEVDGRDYGAIGNEYQVIVDMTQGGKVTVNDQERKPEQPKSP